MKALGKMGTRRTTFVQACLLAGLLALSVPSRADEPPVGVDCPRDENWVACRAAAGDPLAVYRLGRTEYENARETGDFTEALRLARQLNASGDKNGERLLKMTHLQLGWGNHKDYVQAYAWLVEDLPTDEEHIPKMLRQLAEKMTPEQLSEARARAPR